MATDKYIPVVHWDSIEKHTMITVQLVYKGNDLVEIIGEYEEHPLNFVENLRSKLDRLQDKMELFYSKKKYAGNERVKLKLTYIYLMINERNGLYKIGRSLNPNFREKTLQSEVPEVVNIFTSPLTSPVCERKLHSLFSQKRVRGEWFKLSDEDVSIVKNYDYPVYK